MISVYVTCRNAAEAKRIAKELLKKRLAACANIFPIESMFYWKGRLADEKEAAMLLKAKKKNYKKIEEQIKKMHSYKVPCIVALEWKAASKDFSEWVRKNG